MPIAYVLINTNPGKEKNCFSELKKIRNNGNVLSTKTMTVIEC